MALEKSIYTRLVNYEPLTKDLTEYQGTPAVFYQKSPDDSDPGWNHKPQYPRVIADMNLQANAERKSAGTLTVSVYCDLTGVDPESITPQIIAAMKDVILKPDDGFPYAFAWARTDPFELNLSDNTARRVIGQDVVFDILEMPPQDTTDPDPIAALNQWMAHTFDDAVVIGTTPMQEITEASTGHPVIYTQFVRTDIDYEIFAVSFLFAQMTVHVICPNPADRLKLVMAISYRLAEHDELIMLDGSSMRAERVSVDNRSDYLQNGQISITVHYGVMRHRVRPEPLMHVNKELRNSEQEAKDGKQNRYSQSGGYTDHY